jgi:hypothetical protein
MKHGDQNEVFLPFIVTKILLLKGQTILALFLFCGEAAFSQNPSASEPLDGREGRGLLLENFRPKPQLKVVQNLRSRAAFPVVDVHTHFFYKLREGKREEASNL